MKYNILITDILIKNFVNVYKKNFSVDCLWKLEGEIDFNKYQSDVKLFNSPFNFQLEIRK